ncbi:hypothetical protein ACFL17_09800 [Pseudomonadota bacterium]
MEKIEVLGQPIKPWKSWGKDRKSLLDPNPAQATSMLLWSQMGIVTAEGGRPLVFLDFWALGL